MKRLLFSALLFILAMGMAVNAAAAVTAPTAAGVVTAGVKAINESKPIGSFISTVLLNNKTVLELDDLSEIEIGSGDVIKIPLPSSLFLDANGKAFTQANISLQALTAANVNVRASYSKGEGTYNVSLGGNRKESYILIEFNSAIIIDPQKFSSSIYLSKSGARKSSTRIIVKGEIQTKRKELNWGDDYADISDGSLIVAKTPLRNVEIYLGEYCTITRNLARGAAYAGTAVVDDVTTQDLAILNKYPAIQYLYKLKTVGLKTSGNIVSFDLDSKYYVYDSNGTYIGTSDKALPYWTRYYLSDKKYASLNVKANK